MIIFSCDTTTCWATEDTFLTLRETFLSSSVCLARVPGRWWSIQRELDNFLQVGRVSYLILLSFDVFYYFQFTLSYETLCFSPRNACRSYSILLHLMVLINGKVVLFHSLYFSIHVINDVFYPWYIYIFFYAATCLESPAVCSTRQQL